MVIRHQALAADLSRLHGSLSLRGRALEQGEMLASVTSELSHLVEGAYGLSLGLPHPGVARAQTYIHERWRAERGALRSPPMNGSRRNSSTARAQRLSP